MRYTPAICVVSSALALLLTSCSKPKTVDLTPTEPPAEPAATPSPATPKPVVIATPTPAAKRLAPEGVFFLVRSKSVETSDGIIGLKPGTAVMKQPDGSFLAGTQKVELRPDEITNDLDVAARVAGADAQRQAAVRQAGAAQAALAAQPTPASAAKPATSSSSSTSSTVAAAPAPAATSSSAFGSAGLGSTHTMTKDGWLWEKNENGDWKRVKPLR